VKPNRGELRGWSRRYPELKIMIHSQITESVQIPFFAAALLSALFLFFWLIFPSSSYLLVGCVKLQIHY